MFHQQLNLKKIKIIMSNSNKKNSKKKKMIMMTNLNKYKLISML